MNDLPDIKAEEEEKPDNEESPKDLIVSGKVKSKQPTSSILHVIDDEIAKENTAVSKDVPPDSILDSQKTFPPLEKPLLKTEFEIHSVDQIVYEKLSNLLTNVQKYNDEDSGGGLFDGIKISRNIKSLKENAELITTVIHGTPDQFISVTQALEKLSGGYNNKIKQAGNELIENNIETIGQRLECTISPDDTNATLKLVNTFAAQGNESQKRIGMNFLLKHIENVIKSHPHEAVVSSSLNEILVNSKYKDQYELYKKTFNTVLEKGTEAEKQQAISILKNIARGSDIAAQKEVVLHYLGVPTDNPAAPALRSDLINTFFEKWNLDYDKVIRSWDLNRPVVFQEGSGDNSKPPFPYTASENLERMIRLESLKPDIVHTLNKDFNIDNFNRYPMDVLLEQFDTRDRTDIPYSAFMFAKYDRNGVLKSQAAKLSETFKEIKDKHLIRIVEADGDLSGVHMINSMRHKYGPESDTFIMAHGAPDSMQLGDPKGGESQRLSVDDLDEKGAHALQMALAPESNVYLISCEVGGQFVKKLASVLRKDNTVSGSTIQIAKATIIPYSEETEGGSKLRFQVKYIVGGEEAPTIIAQGGQPDLKKPHNLSDEVLIKSPQSQLALVNDVGIFYLNKSSYLSKELFALK